MGWHFPHLHQGKSLLCGCGGGDDGELESPPNMPFAN